MIFRTLITPTVQIVEGAIIFYLEGGTEFFWVVKWGNQFFFQLATGGPEFFRVKEGEPNYRIFPDSGNV